LVAESITRCNCSCKKFFFQKRHYFTNNRLLPNPIGLLPKMAASKLLANMLKKMHTEPVEGFTVELQDESDLFEWRIWVEGPKDTPYEGGVFQLQMKFPPEYPMAPPELKFVSDFWHPNVYKDTGVVCISILHSPVADEMSGELPEERWLPTQTVTTILLSVISLLSGPNFSSPANVDASVEWRKNLDVYKGRCAKLVDKANKEKPSYVVIPHPDTNPEERAKQVEKIKAMEKPVDDMDDFMHDDNVYPDNGDEEEESSSQSEPEEDNSLSSKSSKEEKKPTTNSKPAKTRQTKANKRESSKSKKDSKKHKSKEEQDDGTEVDAKGRKKKKCTIM